MKPVEGIFAAAITPRRSTGHEVDLALLFEVIDFLCAKKVDGIALFGATGEYIHFGLEERVRVAQLVVKRSRAPLIVNVSHSNLDGAVMLAEEAASAGAAGVLLMPPHFFRYSQMEVREFFLQFAKTLQAEIPIYLYNVPFFTNEIAPETACQLLGTGEFMGIKDSSGREDYFAALMGEKEKTSFIRVILGNDSLFTHGRSNGADAVISGVCCGLPELMLALNRAIVEANTEKRGQLQARLMEYIGWLDLFPVPIGVRETVAMRGMKIGPQAIPFSPAAARAMDEFREWFKGWLPELLLETKF
jgi:4-hydroxy-tetrahydrodipicolinate synthase